MDYKICTEVKQLETDYELGYINILDGLTFSQWKTLKMCEFYANSKYLDSGLLGANGQPKGNVNELGMDVPFFNVVNFRVTIAKVGTDLDVKDVDITSDNPNHYIKSMLLRKEAYEWMKANGFSVFLNKMGYTRPKYGGVLVKKFEEKDKLEIQVVQWRNVVTDQVQIKNNPIIERHYMTYAEMLAKSKIWDDVEDVLRANQNLAAAKKYGTKEISNRICVYEVTGEFPREFLKEVQDLTIEDKDRYEYELHRYYIADVYGKNYVLFSEKLKESPYKYLAWEEMEGRALGRGVIEDSEESQVWTNDAIKGEKAAMDLAGKVVAKTTSKKLGSNIFEVDNGKIFELEKDQEFELLNLTPTSIGKYNDMIMKWKEQADGATSSYDANTGEQPPSGTPYSQTALLNQVASKPFDYRREEAGIFITEIFNDWVIPFLVKKLKKSHILVSDFSEEELETIDQNFSLFKANQAAKDAILSGKIVTHEDYLALIESYKQMGSKRYLEIPDGYFDDIQAKVSVNPVNELYNKQAILQSLDHIIDKYIQSFNPTTGQYGVTSDPYLKKLFDMAIELAGTRLSPASLKGKVNTNPAPMPVAAPLPAAAPAA